MFSAGVPSPSKDSSVSSYSKWFSFYRLLGVVLLGVVWLAVYIDCVWIDITSRYLLKLSLQAFWLRPVLVVLPRCPLNIYC